MAQSKTILYIVSQYIPECTLGWQAVTVSVTSRAYRPGPRALFCCTSCTLQASRIQGHHHSGRLRTLRQRQFDTQPSSDSESEHPDLGESTDSGSDGDDQPEEKSDEEVPGDQESGTNDHDVDDDADLDKKRKRAVVSLYKS